METIWCGQYDVSQEDGRWIATEIRDEGLDTGKNQARLAAAESTDEDEDYPKVYEHRHSQQINFIRSTSKKR